MTEKQQRDALAFAAALGPDAPPGLEAFLRGIGSGEAGGCETHEALRADAAALRSILLRVRGVLQTPEGENITEHAVAVVSTSMQRAARIRELEAEVASLAGRLVDVTRGDGRGTRDGREAAALLPRLVDGIRWWAAQEDGIPEQLHEPFNAAMLWLGWTYSTDADLSAAASLSVPRLCNTDAARVEAERLDAGHTINCVVCPECGKAGASGTLHTCKERWGGPWSRIFGAIPDFPSPEVARTDDNLPVTRAELRALLAAGGIIADPAALDVLRARGFQV